MAWNKNPKPRSTGWYLCTIKENNNYRYVMPLRRAEWPEGNFYWDGLNYGEVVACMKFPSPYGGV